MQRTHQARWPLRQRCSWWQRRWCSPSMLALWLRLSLLRWHYPLAALQPDVVLAALLPSARPPLYCLFVQLLPQMMRRMRLPKAPPLHLQPLTHLQVLKSYLLLHSDCPKLSLVLCVGRPPLFVPQFLHRDRLQTEAQTEEQPRRLEQSLPRPHLPPFPQHVWADCNAYTYHVVAPLL